MHGHIKWLINKGIKTIFYPCVSYEENFVPSTDNHYNCPVVANYPVVIGANVPELREDGVRYMHPYFNLANHELMVGRIRRGVCLGQRDPRGGREPRSRPPMPKTRSSSTTCSRKARRRSPT